jgi:hypothetical protein
LNPEPTAAFPYLVRSDDILLFKTARKGSLTKHIIRALLPHQDLIGLQFEIRRKFLRPLTAPTIFKLILYHQGIFKVFKNLSSISV